MSILKLEPGDKVNLSIHQVSTVEGKFGPQYLFTGSTPDESDVALYLNVKTADQQFSRLGLSALQAEGQTLEIERIEKNGTKYTNINRPSGSVPAPRATSNAKQPFTSGPHIPGMDAPHPIHTPEYGDVPAQQKAVDALTTVDRLDRMFKVYGAIESHILATSVKKFEDAKVGASPESVAAQIATLFIQACNKGIAA